MYKTLSLKNELLRKTIHVFNSLIPLSLCLFRQDYITIGVGVALAVWLLLEFLRLSNKKANSIIQTTDKQQDIAFLKALTRLRKIGLTSTDPV